MPDDQSIFIDASECSQTDKEQIVAQIEETLKELNSLHEIDKEALAEMVSLLISERFPDIVTSSILGAYEMTSGLYILIAVAPSRESALGLLQKTLDEMPKI